MARPGFTATADRIRAAAGQAAAAAEGAGGLGLGAVATTISQSLRGTRSAAAAAELAAAWDTAVSTWSADVAAHAQRLTDSAGTYQTNDTEAANRFRTGLHRAR
ncbi:MAG TPA: hypothetical protein VFQ77_09080 [Pseudonocardiaceae bacterium]|jgi:membrane protease subunit (stomatin/prohibitin family)|nr:hypothetical protein [Pseudonocardiaceae bacterium]